MKRRMGGFAGGFALAVPLAVGACSDPAGTQADPLTEAEVTALAEVVAGTVFSTWEVSSGPAPAPQRAGGTLQLGAELPCASGGTVAVLGSVAFDVDDESGDGMYEFAVTHRHNDCALVSRDGIAFTVNGAPDVAVDFVVEIEGDALLLHGNFIGSLAWATGDRSGSCDVGSAFVLDGSLATGTGSASLVGTVCGVRFTSDLELT